MQPLMVGRVVGGMADLYSSFNSIGVHYHYKNCLDPEEYLENEILRQIVEVEDCQHVHTLVLGSNHQEVLLGSVE